MLTDQSRPAPWWVSTGLHTPLWVWLAVAVLASFFGSPADPYSMLLALAYGLLCFWVGIVLGSRIHIVLRFLPLALFIAGAMWAVAVANWDFHLAVLLGYGVVSIASGAWAFRTIQRGRLRILAGFSTGYALGTIAGAEGTILGAVLGTWLVQRFVSKRQRREASSSDAA